MSFRDLDSAPRVGGGHASKQQPKQRKDEDSTFERNIRANIQDMQESVRKAGQQLDQPRRGLLGKKSEEALDSHLERCRQLSQETELLFREWMVHLAGEPSERHRKKFSCEKLQRAFEDEVGRLKEVAKRAVTARQEAAAAGKSGDGMRMVECRQMVDEQDESILGDEAERGLLLDDAGEEDAQLLAMQEEATIRNRIAQEREEGIRRIQGQVSEVNAIFRDLASIVQSQGQQFESIEEQAETASAATKQAVQELKKAVDRQRGTRERFCCMLGIAVLLLCFLVLPHMGALDFGRSEAIAGHSGAAPSGLQGQGAAASSSAVISSTGAPGAAK